MIAVKSAAHFVFMAITLPAIHVNNGYTAQLSHFYYYSRLIYLFFSSSTATAGNVFPSRNSRNAPPPVEI